MSTGTGYYICPHCETDVWFDDDSSEDHSCDGLVAAEREARLHVRVPIDLYTQLLWGLKDGTPLWERAVSISRKWAEDNPDLFDECAHLPTDDGPVMTTSSTVRVTGAREGVGR